MVTASAQAIYQPAAFSVLRLTLSQFVNRTNHHVFPVSLLGFLRSRLVLLLIQAPSTHPSSLVYKPISLWWAQCDRGEAIRLPTPLTAENWAL
ncbi:hypothetical protein PGT21_032070 [Puccinia graminis f. sp. tritici]|uniref:Uncharacterized protein n=1 Tax=Puccinia graminis f. sp. tritici TaxID=56615 RepID=A0A5B0PAB4_PUCGR|nr:hypothetical protein PGT21_032070 [Puccinia graminis f. sp. tritici]